jgi:hypothetical protein
MYLGNQPALSYTSFAKQDFTTSATTSYTLDNPVANANELALFINFVRQEPTTAYTASGTSLTLTSATSASDDMYCVFLGKAVQTVNPPSGSVGSSQISADLITGQTALGATPADTDELLISDAGTLKRVDYSYLKSANTPAFEASLSSTQAINNASYTKVQFATEIFDTNSAYDNVTNYRFTPAVTGKYYLFSELCLDDLNDGSFFDILLYKNGSSIKQSRLFSGVTEKQSSWFSYIDASTSASDYYEIFVYQNTGVTRNLRSDISGYFGGFKIIGA